MTTPSLLDRAAAFAVSAHAGVTRKDSPIPYVSHCFDVMKRLSGWDVTDENVLAAALLHDTLEDTDTTFEQLVELANADVARMVRALSWPAKMSAAAKFDHLRALPGIVDADILQSVLLLKMADRLCNVMDYDQTETRQNTPPNRSYASKYALLGFPVFAAWAARVEATARPVPAALTADLTDYQSIVRRRYSAFESVYTTTVEAVHTGLFSR